MSHSPTVLVSKNLLWCHVFRKKLKEEGDVERDSFAVAAVVTNCSLVPLSTFSISGACAKEKSIQADSWRHVQEQFLHFLRPFRKHDDPILAESETKSTSLSAALTQNVSNDTHKVNNDRENGDRDSNREKEKELLFRLAGEHLPECRALLREKMPAVAAMLHHQLLDVTSVSVAFHWWAPLWERALIESNWLRSQPLVWPTPNFDLENLNTTHPLAAAAHLHHACQTLEESIARMRFYRHAIQLLNCMISPSALAQVSSTATPTPLLPDAANPTRTTSSETPTNAASATTWNWKQWKFDSSKMNLSPLGPASQMNLSPSLQMNSSSDGPSLQPRQNSSSATYLSKYVLWCDIETTSKEVDEAKVMEVSALVTTCDLVRVGKLSAIISHPPGSLDASLSKWSAKQHTSSGLLHACYKHEEAVPAFVFEKSLHDFLDLFLAYTSAFPDFLSLRPSPDASPDFCPARSDTAVASGYEAPFKPNYGSDVYHMMLAGSGVSFDHACLVRHMPAVASQLVPHVVLDVTPLLKAFTWWAPAWRDAKPTQRHQHDHRADADIEDSLALMEFYRKCLVLIDGYLPPSLPPSSLTGVSNPLHAHRSV